MPLLAVSAAILEFGPKNLVAAFGSLFAVLAAGASFLVYVAALAAVGLVDARALLAYLRLAPQGA